MEKLVKILYNSCYGGFGLSEEAEALYKQKTGLSEVYSWELDRTDPVLIEVVETLGLEESSSRFAMLQIAELPKGTKYRIDEYDGYESVMTPDCYEWKIA